MKICPYCKSVLDYYSGKYRCSLCHMWFEESECLEMKRGQPAVVEDAPVENGHQLGVSHQSDKTTEPGQAH